MVEIKDAPRPKTDNAKAAEQAKGIAPRQRSYRPRPSRTHSA
jgi:hypothetical protein